MTTNGQAGITALPRSSSKAGIPRAGADAGNHPDADEIDEWRCPGSQ